MAEFPNLTNRRRPTSTTAAAIAGAAILAVLSACASTGPKRIEATTASMRDTKAMLDDGRKQVSAVMAAARAVEAAPDRARAFGTLVSEIERLERDAARTQAAWASLTSRTDAYVKAWEAESAGLSSEGSRQVAASRREAFAARVGQLRTDLASVKSCYGDFMTKMSDVRILLANDLTAEGVLAVRPFVEEAARSSVALDASIEKLSRDLEAEMGRSATTAPPTTRN